MQPASIDRELNEESERLDLLQHPFYKRWVAGEVSRDELAYYAGQYAHVVRAIPRWLAAAAAQDEKNSAALMLHAAEELEHIALWEEFGAALGISPVALHSTTPNAATAKFIATGDELVSQGHGASVVWSIEAQSPAVSAEKLRGLRAHYGIDHRNGGRYFAVHQVLDLDHEAQLRSVIHTQDEAVQKAAPPAVAQTLGAMWDVLSSVQSATVQSA